MARAVDGGFGTDDETDSIEIPVRPTPSVDPATAPAMRLGGPQGFSADVAAPSDGLSSARSARAEQASGRTSAPFSHLPQIPGYLIECPIGHGGMAAVYKAQRLGSVGIAVPCVIKTILPGKADDPRFRDKFLDEARIYAQLRHPNLVAVLDVGEAEGRLFLAMEWVEGMDAADLIRNARKRTADIPLQHVLFILQETLKGLHHAHSSGTGGGFVHRDISPGNILVSRSGAVKLADFGVARAADELAADGRRTLAGKLHYFAPELVTGSASASASTDVFALGVTFYELLSGAPLFDRKAAWPQLRRDIASFDVQALLERDLTLPEPVEELLRRSLARAPSDRYQSALDFLEAVNDSCHEAGIRLLDVHFARYVSRVIALRDLDGGDLTLRAKLAARVGDDP